MEDSERIIGAVWHHKLCAQVFLRDDPAVTNARATLALALAVPGLGLMRGAR